MQLHRINIADLEIPENRQRKDFKSEDLIKLANSISQTGLIQPVVVRKGPEGNWILVAGERRIRAMAYVWNFGQTFRCAGETFPEGEIPCIYQGELDPIDAFEMELEENIRRTDLSWQERAAATARLMELRKAQAARQGAPEPTTADLSAEIRGESNNAIDATRKELLVSRFLDDPDIEKAKTVDDAFKILKRKETIRKNQEYAAEVGKTFSSKVHRLYLGDCCELMAEMTNESFDVILTDPPYGINAHLYGDSGGRASGEHFYDDSPETWSLLMQVFSRESFRLAKPAAHLYCFCDIENFPALKMLMEAAGWRVFRTPLIWHNPTAMRTPWPEHGPQRKYQIILYAIKGQRPTTIIAPDVVTFPSDENLGHEAQKPIALLEELLRRSIRPGDTIFDPFCGTGSIFPAAHKFTCQATGIELSAAAYGIAAKRIEALE